MSDDALLDKVHSISDLELAALLCLICREHCIISTEPDALDDLVQELQLISTQTFGLKPVLLDCHPLTTLDDFASAIQLPQSPLPSSPSPPPPAAPRPPSPYRRQSHFPHTTNPNSYFHHSHHHHHQASFSHTSYHTAQSTHRLASLTPAPSTLPIIDPSHNRWPSTASGTTTAAAATVAAAASPILPPLPGATSSGQVANVILAKNLNLAPKAVQIQALELLRTKRLFTRTSVLVAPRQFMFIAVLPAPGDDVDELGLPGPGGGIIGGGVVKLTPHLNDYFYLAHWHDPEDGFLNLEDEVLRDEEGGEEIQEGERRNTGIGNGSKSGGKGEFEIPSPYVYGVDAYTDENYDDVDTDSLESVLVRTNTVITTPMKGRREGGFERRSAPTQGRGSLSIAGGILGVIGGEVREVAPAGGGQQGQQGGQQGGQEGWEGGEESLFTEQDLSILAKRSQLVEIDVDVTRYQMNIVSFLRLHRAVAGGVSPNATRHFEQLVRCLAPLHGIDFATPSLVALAAKKIYLHRIEIVKPEKERSMQWGSDVRVIRELLAGMGPEDVIEDVLGMVGMPL